MFPDSANVAHIRDALWRHKAIGGASIMVGAGFSRNATSASVAIRPMPTWSDMARALCEPLYPTDAARLQAAMDEASGTSGFLKLAQEYQVAFGVSSLNDKIRNLVPDLDYQPGDLHKRLLRLPWADVFTTNWDTLLERACADVFDRNYDVVRTVSGVPFSSRPRIVKLHGTFPSHEPFIFTEEDYRTFPKDFAPLVNLVQQSMMETIFCLVGFSGDDPNFLHWAGWVRDNLGEKAPKIYLVGWLGLSVHRRRMLEKRNVMPVDLADLPQGKSWPEALRHKYATEWFINALESGEPYDPSSWPSPGNPSPSAPPHIEPGLRVERSYPRAESLAPSFSGSNEDQPATLWATVEAWSFNRKLYPGWLVAPDHVRQTVWMHTSYWLEAFPKLLPSLSDVRKFIALAELQWRMETALLPFPPNLEEMAFEALAGIDLVTKKIGGDTSGAVGATEFTEMYLGLALALARNARYDGNHKNFNRALALLRLAQQHSVEAGHAIVYEECLWNLSTNDVQKVRELLNTWSPTSNETLWLLRKAGLLAALEQNEPACSLLEKALVQIRRARRRDIDDFVSLSREAWALFLGIAYSSSGWGPALADSRSNLFKRWRDLGVLDCDASSDYNLLKRSLESTNRPVNGVTKRRGFDLNRQHETHHLRSGPSETLVAAYQMVMLADKTGIPPSANNHSLFDKGMELAAKELADSSPWLACQIVFRILPSASSELIDNVFSRSRVATLNTEQVASIHDGALRRAEFAISETGRGEFRRINEVGHVSVFIEFLSRVALRVPEDQLRDLLTKALSYYASDIFRLYSGHLQTTIRQFLTRVMEAFSEPELTAVLDRIFAAPLPYAPGTPEPATYWPDPVECLPDDFIPTEKTHGRDWGSIVSALIVSVEKADSVNRAAAVFRLYRLWSWKFLTGDEVGQFAAALWTPSRLDVYGLPAQTNLLPWAFLGAPESQPGQAQSALERLLAGLGTMDTNNRLYKAGGILAQAGKVGIDLSLSDDVKKTLLASLSEWAATRLPDSPSRFFSNMDNRKEPEALQGVKSILEKMDIPPELAESIWQKSDYLAQQEDFRLNIFELYPILSKIFPQRTHELIDRLRRALVSDQEDVVRSAVFGLSYWIDNAEKTGSPPSGAGLFDDLVREIGISLAARRSTILIYALGLARWIFTHKLSHFENLIARDCEHGLNALFDEAAYSRSGQPFDVPSIRAGCVKLAWAMKQAGLRDNIAVEKWLIEAINDPLPEVRNAAKEVA